MRILTKISRLYFVATLLALLVAIPAPPAGAIDTDVTRMTLSGLQGVSVGVEELQPNLMKYLSLIHI